ncbi:MULTISPECIES: YhdP family protein [unclassified Duganella]|uniref:YhdP family protein n=1 Tax=unclassified Duganella TaxID=2636909 RepID=UPI00087F96F9|nr:MULTISPECIES: YhdP family protein [unclassified Duganella]SDH04114.1 TIGR02099 family protein [Duganella sp. OV458]SDK21958.1 TIGR02099 family protein [Duganella sp. OV510]
MQKPEEETVTGEGPLAARWHRLSAAYRFCNQATHHVLGFTVKLALLLYFAFTILFLTLRYVVLPNIDHYRDDIERAASHAVGNQVTISRVYASWSGFRPNLFLGDVVLHDQHGRPALTLPSVSATLSWWTAVTGTVRFHALELHRPDLNILRDNNGKLYVAGIFIDPDKPSDGKGLDWLLTQRQIVIHEGRVQWTDRTRVAPPLALDNVTLVLINNWLHHEFSLRATPPGALAAPLDVRADFSHPAFGARISNVSMWKGELYADLRNADLLAWKSWIDYPFELSKGSGSLRAWVGVDQSRLTGFTADVGLNDVTAVLGKDLPLLDLQQMSGRIAMHEDIRPPLARKGASTPRFGALGHTLELRDLTLTTRDGLVMAPTSLSETYVAAAGARPEKVEVRARQLDLQTIAGLAERLPLSERQHQMVAGFAPRGLLKNFSAEWQGSFPALQTYRVKGDLVGLGLKPQPPRLPQARSGKTPAIAGMPALPGFDNLSGAIDATEQGGSFSLNSQQLVLQMPDYFAEASMPFDHLNLKARWSFEADNNLLFQIDSMDFEQEGLQGTLQGTHLLSLAGKGPGKADLSGTLTGFQINRIGRYLPMQTPHDITHWLTGALEGGTASDVTIRLRGDLAHFPFHGEGKAHGEFRVAGKLTDAKLNYEPGYYLHDGKELGKDGKPLPLWPQAEHIKGSFVFERARMEIRGDTATTAGVALSNVKAVIPDLSIHDSMLEIDGNAAGPMQEFLKYVAISPVLGWISHFTDETQATGNAKLALSLRIPLAHALDTKVNGTLTLANNDITLMNDLPVVQSSQGKIEFNEHGVNLNQLSGNFLGGPVSITGGSQKDNSIVVKLGGLLTADGFRQAYPMPAMQRLADRFSGSTRYSGTVTARDHQLQIAVDSSLTGLALDLPAPLQKSTTDSMPVRFLLNAGLTPDAGGLLHDDIRISLGSSVMARYQRQKMTRQHWKLVRGGIGVNTPAPEPDSGLAFNINMRELNVDNWLDFGDAIAGQGAAAASASPALDATDFTQYVLPDAIAARSSELIIGGRKLENIVVGVTHLKGSWQASIDSTQANGYVTWIEPSTGAGLGKATARLSSLVIPASASSEVQELLDGKSAAATIPALDVVVERFELFNKPLGRLELQAHNAQLPNAREWRVSKLSLANADGELNGSGKWVSKSGVHDTSLNFNLAIHDAGKLLERFGFADTVKNGKGTLKGDIAWKGVPYSLDLPSLSGQIALNVEKGQFLKQDPGAAKLLGVLSLQALPRLLKLDFHDVFSEGLAFDGITASATIERGIVRTDNLKMHGVAATVLMDGVADMANETTNLHVVVIPEVNLGTAPLVYALAVNPVIGLGSFLAQLFLSAPVMKALTYHMQVSGPWKAPVVTKLDATKTEPPKGSP